MNKDNEQFYKDMGIDGEPCDSYPDFNAWVKALEADPDFIEKEQKRLDKELGKSRPF